MPAGWPILMRQPCMQSLKRGKNLGSQPRTPTPFTDRHASDLHAPALRIINATPWIYWYTELIMVKRKAGNLENGIPTEEPRRSSRKKTTVKEEVPMPVLDDKSKPTPAKRSKKVPKNETTAVGELNGVKVESSRDSDLVCLVLLSLALEHHRRQILRLRNYQPALASHETQLTAHRNPANHQIQHPSQHPPHLMMNQQVGNTG